MTANNVIRVLQLTRYDRLGGSSRLRFYDFKVALKEHGICITPAPFFDNDYITGLYGKRRASLLKIIHYYARRFLYLLQASKYDLIWLEKEALPWIPAWVEKTLLGMTPYVIDFDDAWFHRYDMHTNPLLRRMLAKKFPTLVSGASSVIAGSPYLAEWAKAQGAQKIVRIPTTVDLGRYKVKPPETNEDFVIGWMGSPSTAGYLCAIGEVLEYSLDKPATKVKLVGGVKTYICDPRDSPSWCESKALISIPWTEANEVADLCSFDVGIMPLASDPWSEGKCAYKLIQYMAVGLPVVASPIGMNREVVTHGVNGFLANDTNEWITALEILRGDPGLRRRMGAAGRKIVEERYALTGNTGLLVQTLQNAATKDVPK